MSEALAECLDEIAAAFTKFAQNLRSGEVAAVGVKLRSEGLEDMNLGDRQREIVEVLAVADDKGLTTSGVAALMDNYETPNAHTALRTLEGRKVVEEVPGERPIRWRLTQQYRGTSDPYLRIAGLVPKGKWTTYGDISIAVRGDTHAARAVGRAAAKLPIFPTLTAFSRVAASSRRAGTRRTHTEPTRTSADAGLKATGCGSTNVAVRVATTTSHGTRCSSSTADRHPRTPSGDGRLAASAVRGSPLFR